MWSSSGFDVCFPLLELVVMLMLIILVEVASLSSLEENRWIRQWLIRPLLPPLCSWLRRHLYKVGHLGMIGTGLLWQAFLA